VTDPSTPPTWRVVALVGRVEGPEILVREGVDSPALPTADRPIQANPFEADAVEVVDGMLRVPVVPIRLTWLPDEGWKSGTIVVETEPLEVAPAGTRWQDPTMVIESLEPVEARPVVLRRVQRSGAPPPAKEPPYARSGWFEKASGWMVERLTDAGLPVTESPRLAYQGPMGAVLQARSDGRSTFLKWPTLAFPHEAAITHTLSRHAPDAVPAVIASEPDRNWLLMHDHRGRPVEDEPPDRWIDGLRNHAALQRASVTWADEIPAVGGQTRSLERLAGVIPTMLDYEDLGGRLAPDVREAWIAALPSLLDACAALNDAGLPDTLVHGDLHPGNIVVTPDDRYVVVDWSDAALGNPLVDLATYLTRTKDRDLRGRLLDAYVATWNGLVDRARLDTAVNLAMAVGCLYQVQTYQALDAALDEPDRAIFTGSDAGWAKRAVDFLEQGLDAGLSDR
jgi:aminoglycoside phosphotransferase (APT) family kinase protein